MSREGRKGIGAEGGPKPGDSWRTTDGGGFRTGIREHSESPISRAWATHASSTESWCASLQLFSPMRAGRSENSHLT